MMQRRHDRFFAWDGTVIVGDVTVGEDTNFWPFSCVRGDVAPITIGARVSVQDFAMIHCRHGVPLEIGDDVVIGHHATVHCKRVGAGALIGIGAVVLDGAEIGAGALVAAGAIVRPGTIVEPGMMVAGVPAKPIRPITADEQRYQTFVAANYLKLARDHIAGRYPAQ